MNRKDLGKISVIVSTYNRCDALQVCLLSLFKQTVLPDEVIIGDDALRKRPLVDSKAARAGTVSNHTCVA